MTAPAMRILGPPHDGKDHDFDLVIVGEVSYRRMEGRWEKGKINLLGRTILVHHTVGRVDPESCRRLGEVHSEGETFAIYGFASAPIYDGKYPYEEREVWIDN